MKSPQKVIHWLFCIWYLTRAPGPWRLKRYISTAKLLHSEVCAIMNDSKCVQIVTGSVASSMANTKYVTRSRRNPVFCFYITNSPNFDTKSKATSCRHVPPRFDLFRQDIQWCVILDALITELFCFRCASGWAARWWRRWKQRRWWGRRGSRRATASMRRPSLRPRNTWTNRKIVETHWTDHLLTVPMRRTSWRPRSIWNNHC